MNSHIPDVIMTHPIVSWSKLILYMISLINASLTVKKWVRTIKRPSIKQSIMTKALDILYVSLSVLMGLALPLFLISSDPITGITFINSSIIIVSVCFVVAFVALWVVLFWLYKKTKNLDPFK